MSILLAIVVGLIGITLIAVDIISRLIDIQVQLVHSRIEVSVTNLITKIENTKTYSILSWLNLVNRHEGN